MKKDDKKIDNNNRDDQAFFSAFLHKLKNPLHSIGINLEVARSKIKKESGKNAKEAQKHLDIIADELSTLHRITDFLSDYLLTAKSKQSKVNVNQMIHESINVLSATDPNGYKMIEFGKSSSKLTISADKESVQRALVELLANAIEASREGNKVTIKSIQENVFVKILISDNGTGISKKEQKRIFDPFYSTKKGRLGCGLPLAKRLLEANAGSIEIKSTIKKGTAVVLKFKATG